MKSGNIFDRLRKSKIGMYVYPVVAPEFTNWRSEQAGWRNSVVLYDQTNHMDEVTVEGPDAEAFLAHVGINDFSKFGTDRAKHFVPVTPAGHVIGDHVIFRLEPNKFLTVGRAPTSNWIMFQAAIRLRVSPTPYSTEARTNYADSWRTKGS